MTEQQDEQQQDEPSPTSSTNSSTTPTEPQPSPLDERPVRPPPIPKRQPNAVSFSQSERTVSQLTNEGAGAGRAYSERISSQSIREGSVRDSVDGSVSASNGIKLYQRSESTRRLKKSNSNVTTSVFSNLRSTTTERARVVEDQKMRHKYFPVFFPWDKRYKAWWGFTVFAAVFTIFVETYGIAFSPAGLPNPTDANAILEYILYSIFVVDMAINFNLAFYAADGQVMVNRQWIAQDYMRNFFWVDFVGVFPFYPIALAMTGELGQDSKRAQFLALLRLTRMVRVHRVKQLFDVLQLTSKVSLLWLTLIRNLAAAVIYTHLGACTSYFISRQFQFDEDRTMYGADHSGLNKGERYIASLYWSVATFATVGYGDYHPHNAAEQLFCLNFMYVNMVVQAWIIGSITLLIVKHDEKTGLYRDALQKLSLYSGSNGFDRAFHTRLKTAVKLNFDSREITDEEILRHFPSAVRRKVLRKLYVPSLMRTSLMKGLRQQFIDSFLVACTVEVFSPDEEILQLGSISSDLYLLVSGTVELVPLENNLKRARDNEYGTTTGSGASTGDAEGAGGLRTRMGEGEFLNEISFFTECPQIDSVKSVGVCKTLTMPRSAYKQLCADHPGSCGLILQNLSTKVNEMVANLSRNQNQLLGSRLDQVDDPSYQSNEMQRTVTSVQTEAALSSIQELVRMRISSQKDEYTTKFLFAASRGDTTTVANMCDQGFDPNSGDYDNRTGLMLAAMKGSTDVVKKLLEEYACNPNLLDVHGSSALFEAARNGHEETMDVLLKHGARLGMSQSNAASALCQAVFDGDNTTLRRLLRAKIDVNASDYDKRTAAHIAAAEGNLTALQVLVEFGADLNVRDRWDNSIEDEASKADASEKMLTFVRAFQGNSHTKLTDSFRNKSRRAQSMLVRTADTAPLIELDDKDLAEHS